MLPGLRDAGGTGRRRASARHAPCRVAMHERSEDVDSAYSGARRRALARRLQAARKEPDLGHCSRKRDRRCDAGDSVNTSSGIAKRPLPRARRAGSTARAMRPDPCDDLPRPRCPDRAAVRVPGSKERNRRRVVRGGCRRRTRLRTAGPASSSPGGRARNSPSPTLWLVAPATRSTRLRRTTAPGGSSSPTQVLLDPHNLPRGKLTHARALPTRKLSHSLTMTYAVTTAPGDCSAQGWAHDRQLVPGRVTTRRPASPPRIISVITACFFTVRKPSRS